MSTQPSEKAMESLRQFLKDDDWDFIVVFKDKRKSGGWEVHRGEF